MNKRKVLVFGGRNFTNYDFLCRILDDLYDGKQIIVIEGEADGADKYAKRWAESRGHEVDTCKPDWSKGRSAGFVRNSEMVAKSEEAVGFWDCISTGTLDTIKKLIKSGKQTRIYFYR